MTDQLTLEEGLALKEKGMALASLAEPEPYKQRARGAISYFASLGTPFTAEDVRELVGDPEHPNSLGALFSAAVKVGQIRRWSDRPAVRAQRHASLLRVWIGT